MMAILAMGGVILLLVGLSVYVGWLMMPLCPGERDGFEEYDLRLLASEPVELTGDVEFSGDCDAQGRRRIAGAVVRTRGEGPGRAEVFMGSLPCAPRPTAAVPDLDLDL